MLRKLWVMYLHPTILAQIRQSILIATNYDIDQGFKPEMIKKIKYIYENVFKMKEEQMKMFLPTESGKDKNSQVIEQRKEMKRSPSPDFRDEVETIPSSSLRSNFQQ